MEDMHTHLREVTKYKNVYRKAIRITPNLEYRQFLKTF